jgi:hypothetical protein
LTSVRRSLVGVVAAIIASLAPVQTFAACVRGGEPSYDDIRYVSVRQYAQEIPHPSYVYEGFRNLARLSAKREVPLRGDFVAVDPLSIFTRVVAILRSASFFDMRLTPARVLYIGDGAEDAIAVEACGMTWTLGPTGHTEVELDDEQAHEFFKLEDELRAAIFSAKWIVPTPAP